MKSNITCANYNKRCVILAHYEISELQNEINRYVMKGYKAGNLLVYNDKLHCMMLLE